MTINRELRLTLMASGLALLLGAITLLVSQSLEEPPVTRVVTSSLPLSSAAYEIDIVSMARILDTLTLSTVDEGQFAPLSGAGQDDFGVLANRISALALDPGKRHLVDAIVDEYRGFEEQLAGLQAALADNPAYFQTGAGRRHLAGILATQRRLDTRLRGDLQGALAEDVRAINAAHRQELLASGIVMAILVVIVPLMFLRIAHLVRRRVIEPVEQIQATLAEYSHGNPQARVNTPHDDEIGRIAAKVNSALDTIQRQSVTKKRMREIVDAIATYVVAVDGQGHITFSNERFGAFLFRNDIDATNALILDLLPEEVRAPLSRAMAQNDLPVALTTVLQVADRPVMPVRLVVAAIHSTGDDRFLFVVQDRTDWSMMQHRLASSEQERQAVQAALATSEARARELEWSMLDVAEREQRRIGRDLHDGLGQRLTGIAFLSKVLVQRARTLAPELVDSTEWIVSLINEAIDDVRRVSRELNPVGFEETDLGSALQRLAADLRRTWGISCEFVDQVNAADIQGRLALNIYRIVQECTGNAMRHGRAATLSILLEKRRGNLRLAVIDDGTGFDVRQTKGGSGLGNIRARVLSMGGRVRVRSSAEGTRVIVNFPDPTRTS